MTDQATDTDLDSGATRYWLGVYYPTGYTVAVIDDLDEARTCAQELIDADIPPTDVQVITGNQALDIHRRQRQQESLFDKILGAFPTDEHSIQDDYLAQASEGSNFIAFRAHHKRQETQARQILATHHARHLRHYGRWMWEDAS